MRTTIHLLPAILLLSACGTMQETTQVRDDVYDIPDRTVVASVAPAPQRDEPRGNDDYYDPDQASRYQQGSYYDRTYNDPQWYNRGRFGFGIGMNSWGSNYGMGMSYGWPSNGWYNSPTGMYNPYWGNSWMSGYGAWGSPYGYYNPWNNGFYDPWGWNQPFGYGYGVGYGYGGYGNYFGGCGYCGGGWGWPGNDFSTTYIVSHRPSMSGGGSVGGANVNVIPRSGRTNNISLLRPAMEQPRTRTRPNDTYRPEGNDRGNPNGGDRVRQQRQERNRPRVSPQRPREDRGGGSPSFDRGGGGRSGGGGFSPSSTPRPPR